jgi:hypothetical protein
MEINRLLLLSIGVRLFSWPFLQTSFVPDEYWQGTEVRQWTLVTFTKPSLLQLVGCPQAGIWARAFDLGMASTAAELCSSSYHRQHLSWLDLVGFGYAVLGCSHPDSITMSAQSDSIKSNLISLTLIIGGLAGLADWYTVKYTQNKFGPQVALWCMWAVTTAWFLHFNALRQLSGTLSGLLLPSMTLFSCAVCRACDVSWVHLVQSPFTTGHMLLTVQASAN